MDEETNTGIAWQIPVRYKIVMVAVAVAVVTVLAVWLVPDDRQSTPPSLPELPAPQMTDADLFQSIEGDPAAIREGARARGFIASLRSDGAEPDPDTVFVEAMRLQGEGYAVDAYLLFRFAARHGHGQAALLLGNQADPAYRDADIPDSLKDQPEQAYKWYSMAAEEGSDEAAAQLQALRKRMERSASNGDERAQRLLLLWD
jgi:TPR repeat protein